ncbi:MAG: hypothetical protein HQK84_02680 [Nitrospinae bacterium]|nr:hypothetical protein [Nitrospinota bacterium]
MKLLDTFLTLLTKEVYIPPENLKRYKHNIKDNYFHFSFLKEIFISLPVTDKRKDSYTLLENIGRLFLVERQNMIASIIPLKNDLSALPPYLNIYGETLEVSIDEIKIIEGTPYFLTNNELTAKETFIDSIVETSQKNALKFIFFILKDCEKRSLFHLFPVLESIREKSNTILGFFYREYLEMAVFEDLYIHGIDFVGLTQNHKEIEKHLLKLYGNLGMAYIYDLSSFNEPVDMKETFHSIEMGITPLVLISSEQDLQKENIKNNLINMLNYLEGHLGKLKYLPYRNRLLSPFNVSQILESSTGFHKLKRTLDKNLLAGKTYVSLMDMKRKLRVKETNNSYESSGL